MSQIHLFRSGEVSAIAVSVNESGLDDVRIVQHELLDGGSLSRSGIAELVESLNEGEPSE